MAVPKLKLEQPLYVAVTEGGKKVFEKRFFHAPITIGRSLSCDVPLAQYNWISRQHFQVVNVEGRWVATDLNSSSGITVNGERLSQVDLNGETRLDVGPLSFRFNFESQATVSAPTASRPKSTRVTGGNGATLSAVSEETIYDEPYPTPPPMASAVPQPKPKPVEVPPLTLKKVSKAAFQPPRPVQFREPNRSKLNGAWFSKKAEKKHGFVGKPNGVAALKLNSLVKDAGRVNPARMVVEVYLTWKDQIYDSKLYFPGEQISVGTHVEDLYAPTLKGSFIIGRFDGKQTDFFLGKGARGSIHRANNQMFTLEQLIQSDALPRRQKNYVLSLKSDERTEIDFGAGLKLHARYALAPRQLSKNVLREPDRVLKKAITVSGSFHLAFGLIALLLAPAHEIPKVKSLPPRVAKLLLHKPTPPPKKVEPPPPPPEPPKMVEKKEPPKPKKPEPIVKRVPPKPKTVTIKKSEKLKVINKLPPAKVAVEKSPVPPPKKPEPPPPDLNTLGALAAFGALGTPTPNPQNKPIAINVNQNAGGQAGISTSKMVGAMKAPGGQLALGAGGVKTTGKGFGTGTGYGVQGLKGTAGTRGVGGAVVGTPQLFEVQKNDGLTQKQVMDVVKKHVAAIQNCYERSLLSDPTLKGRVEYEWDISSKGAVNWVKVKRSDMATSDVLNNCVTAVFKKMSFPVAANGQGTTPTIGFPFGRL